MSTGAFVSDESIDISILLSSLLGLRREISEDEFLEPDGESLPIPTSLSSR